MKFIYTSDSDFTSGTTITIEPPGPASCIDFTDLIVNDDIGLEGDESFTIIIDGTPAMSMVTITEDDGESLLITRRMQCIVGSLRNDGYVLIAKLEVTVLPGCKIMHVKH